MAVIFSPDATQARLYTAVKQVVERFNVSEAQVWDSIQERLLLYFCEFDNAKNSVFFNIGAGFTPKADEIPLAAQDGFVLSAIGRGARRVTKVGTDYVSSEPIMWTNQPQYFNGVSATTGTIYTEYKSLGCFFNGKFELKETAGSPIISAYSGLLSYNEPLGNYTPAVSLAVPEEYPQYSIDTALHPLYPMQIMLGSQNYVARVDFTNGDYSQVAGLKDSAAAARTTQNIAVLALRGFVIPGLASAKLIADK